MKKQFQRTPPEGGKSLVSASGKTASLGLPLRASVSGDVDNRKRRVVQDMKIGNTTLGIKVEALETDVREIKDAVGALDAKVAQEIGNLGHELRDAIGSIASQFTERSKTPWITLISAAGLIVTVMGFIGHQSLDPISADVRELKQQMVPRAEIEVRSKLFDKRIEGIEASVLDIQKSRIDQLQRLNDRLEVENRALHQAVKP